VTTADGWRVHSPTAVFTGDVVHQETSAGCSDGLAVSQWPTTWFYRVREVAPSTFVELTIEVE
jgi:hypothetical protein